MCDIYPRRPDVCLSCACRASPPVIPTAGWPPRRPYKILQQSGFHGRRRPLERSPWSRFPGSARRLDKITAVLADEGVQKYVASFSALFHDVNHRRGGPRPGRRAAPRPRPQVSFTPSTRTPGPARTTTGYLVSSATRGPGRLPSNCLRRRGHPSHWRSDLDLVSTARQRAQS
jgi:hypothetical protein